MVPRRLGFNIYQVGTAVALLSITSFFVALILVYLFSFQQIPMVRHVRIPWTLWASTGVLVASSITLEAARYSLRRGRVEDYRSRIQLTGGLGLLFLLLQTASLIELLNAGVYMASNPRGSVYYVFTAIHGAHLLGGLFWLTYLLKRLRTVRPLIEQDLRRQRNVNGAGVLYWHFIGVLWIVLFALLLRWS